MRRIALAAALVAVFAVPAQAHERLGPHQTARATAYSGACDGQSTQTADGHGTYFGVIASTWLPMHAVLRLDHPIRAHFAGRWHVRRYLRVRDTGGAFDVWFPDCDQMGSWGVRRIGFRLVRHS